MDFHNQFSFGPLGEGDRLDVRIDRTSRVRRKSEYSLVTWRRCSQRCTGTSFGQMAWKAVRGIPKTASSRTATNAARVQLRKEFVFIWIKKNSMRSRIQSSVNTPLYEGRAFDCSHIFVSLCTFGLSIQYAASTGCGLFGTGLPCKQS